MKPVYIISVILTVLALVTALFFMPAAELIPAQVEPGPIAPGLSPVRSEHAMEFFGTIGRQLSEVMGYGGDLQAYVQGNPKATTPAEAPGELRAYQMWAVFFALALVLAALAIGLIGRLESEEKTVLPVKK
jgi:hypothetical protein